MRITRTKAFDWTTEKELKLATIMIKAAKDALPVNEAFFKVIQELDCTIAVARNHWYGKVKPTILDQYQRAQNLAGVKEAARPDVTVTPKPQAPVQQEMELVNPETPAEEPQAVAQPESAPTELMELLKGNAAALNALAYLVNKNAKMDQKITDLKRVIRSRDQEIIIKNSEIEALEKKLGNIRKVQNGR